MDFEANSAAADAMISRAVATRGSFLWFGFGTTRIGTPVALTARRLLDPSDLLPLGTMFVGLRVELLRSIYKAAGELVTVDPHVFLVDQGTIFLASRDDAALTTEFSRWIGALPLS
jgi:hypothetical protein